MLPHFSTLVAKKRKNFDLIFVLKRANIAQRQQMMKAKLLHKYWIVDRGFTKNPRKLKPRI